MSLDGLRAWIGMVERRLTMRTRVFLVLVAIAVGGAGAAVYLGIEAQDGNVSEGDLQSVQDELGGRIDALESRVETLEAEGDASLLPEGGLEGESNPESGGTPGTGTVPQAKSEADSK